MVLTTVIVALRAAGTLSRINEMSWSGVIVPLQTKVTVVLVCAATGVMTHVVNATTSNKMQTADRIELFFLLLCELWCLLVT